ncbi:MAG: alanyl-tRNA synthetase [Patescibacteria group bacterium]|jgi:alanyl-tRNA synthetase|nr:alanyl-tRNA synthetase [Patescibacteria group bacterium]
MTSNQIREKFLKFFESKGHSVIPSASLIPENDNSVLFTTAGMQPLVPYLLGKEHLKGRRLASSQKCLRTGDIDDIGDNRHLTFFEMLGNWSLGDYFKEESIAWSFEFLTSKENGLSLDSSRLYVTCFEGDESAPRDEESKNIWMKTGIPENRIYFLGKEDNWWGPGENGPCGPDTEIFYDVTGKCGDLSHEDFLRAQKEEKVIEIWNNVFMEYESKDGKVIGKLAQKNVDTGMGLERITAVINGKDNVYNTDCFEYILNSLPSGDEKSRRIIADHMRASCFLISDGVLPGNSDRAYILRRLLRGAIRHGKKIGFEGVSSLVLKIAEKYKESYSLDVNFITPIVEAEENKFLNTLDKGLKEFEKGERDTFLLFTSYGFPVEMTIELAREKGETIDIDLFNQKMKEHQDKSRAGGEQKFKGGLAGTSEAIVKLHTAHHLLLAALQKVLGTSVKQRGSNITEERLRMDFSFDRKMTDEEKSEVEKLVNEAIEKDYKVVKREMLKSEAEKIGAEMEFGAKYEDIVSVYFVEKGDEVFSKEFCGGPHVEHTGILGKFKIQKEEASSAGVRRIKAVLE